jgi:Fe-S-cluster-containing dehydrogenase component/DMSO reductase anchor subunit
MAESASAKNVHLTSVHAFLAEQNDLTAVEAFARAHEELPPTARRYRDLIPLSAPRAGQQYAFDVDLDRCTGCKACVSGCHSLNGLDEGELWRTVGLLVGGTAHAPAQQTITTSCHHCVEPACMLGCPVKAYEKDPVTGIVKHLDDQCIGCQYCLFMCPYDAPKYSAKRGIVRKCDLCSDRLAHQEAPVCVQSCPNEAIRITVVEQSEIVEAAQANAFLPGAWAPGDTLPTTSYRSQRGLPRNLLPADFYALEPQHAHLPLVIMLVLTQLSVGAFVVGWLMHTLVGDAGPRLGFGYALVALGLGMAALSASVLHLGRPRYAFRAVLGLKTSWLSREILAFSLFAGVASGYAASLWLPQFAPWRPLFELATVVSGVAAVGCSVMVYAATRREVWRLHITALKFGLAALVLGGATVIATTLGSGVERPWSLCGWLAAVAGFKLASELAQFRHLARRQHTALKRTAMLMAGDLVRVTTARFVIGAIGGVLVPLIIWAAHPEFSSVGARVAVGGLVFGGTVAGELLERYLFFTAASARKMPGGPA